MKFKSLFLLFAVVLFSGCTPKESTSDKLSTLKSTDTNQEKGIEFSTTATVQKEPKYLAFDIVQDSQTRIALFPIECLEKKG